MTTMEALELFIAQLEASLDFGTDRTKVVLCPSSVRDSGVVVKVSLKKTYLSVLSQGAPSTRIIKIRLVITGSIGSVTGLKQALGAIEALDTFLEKPRNLEKEGVKIPDTRVIQTISEEDSFIDAPDSIEVQDAYDERTITVTVPVS